MNADARVKAGPPAANDAFQWFTPGRFAVLLGVLLVVAFPAVVTGQRTFVFGDYGLFGYPLAYYHRQSFWRGEVPLWNPLSDFGLPFLAQWNTLTCYPLSLIYLLFPLPWSLGFYCLFHLFLAGLGMYLFANEWTSHRLAACVAGTAYAFSGLALHCLIWPNNIAALGWMPWVVLCADRATRLGGRHIVIAATVGAMQMLAGAPEVILFTWTIALLICITQSFRPAPLQRLATLAALVTGLAAVQLLPFLDLMAHSHRETSQANTECAMPITGWANFLVPLFRCTSSPPGLYFQPGQFWTYSYYLSLVVVAAALCSVLLVRKREVWLLAGLTGLCLVLAMGDQAYLYAWLRRVFPPLNFVNFPVKFVVAVTFCVPLLGAFAICEWQTAGVKNKSPVLRGTIVVWGFAVGATLAILWYARHYPKDYEQWPIMCKNALTRALFLTVTLAIFHRIKQSRALRQQLLLGLCALGLIWLDGLTHLPRQNPTVPPSILASRLPVFQKLVPLPRHGESRVMLSAPALKRFQRALLPDVANTYIGHRLGLYFNCNLLEDIPKAGGFYSLYLPEQVLTMVALYAPTNGIAQALADFMSVSQISSETNMLEWTARTNYLQMATTGQRPIFAGQTETFIGLLAPDFDPRQVVYLLPEARPYITVTNQTHAKVDKTQFLAHRVRLQVVAEQPSLLLISQTFYHPWRASVDGKTATLWRANMAYQALEVPAGKHDVKLIYIDIYFRIGALISCLVLVATWIAFLNRKQSLQLAREPQIACTSG